MTAVAEHAVEEPFHHPALYYSGPAEYLAGIVPFVESALAAGEPVAVSVPGPNLALLRDALGATGEHVLMLDMAEEGANPGRIIPGVLRDFADRHPGRRVSIVGEPIWASRSEAEYPACAQHEALINLAFAGRDAAILCPYGLDTLDERALADSLATHPVLMDAKGTRASGAYDPQRVLDRYNRPLPAPPRHAVARGVDRESVDNARWFTASYGRNAGLSALRLIDLEIAVTELVTNSVMYGGGTGVLRIWTEDDHLVCEVSDAGRITDPLVGRRPVDEYSQGGGLLLVNHVVDLLRTHTGPEGTTMRLYLRLSD
ncbi:anti-sigma factor RsbA family regulatory protein [Glycomyces endophyticus]|uniref:anti-sigma factor RsbA family regulatory protein n=1 Tax=Glycomyces endophyticus TaxID=480996 RepID=UPI0031DF85F6